MFHICPWSSDSAPTPPPPKKKKTHIKKQHNNVHHCQQVVPDAGHSANEPGIAAELVAANERLKNIIKNGL